MSVCGDPFGVHCLATDSCENGQFREGGQDGEGRGSDEAGDLQQVAAPLSCVSALQRASQVFLA